MNIFCTCLLLGAAATANIFGAEPALAVAALPKFPSPPYLTAAESARLFEIQDGYRLELVLSEPQIQEPVVTVFDGNGRMFVAEMRAYMRNIDGTDEKVPSGRVSLHWSSRGDGVFDRHSVFIDQLVLPRILLPLKDSLLVQETDSADIVEYRDTDGDGVADQKKIWYTGEERRANLEHQTSGLIWSADNWLYSTYNSYRIRWTPTGIVKEPTGANGGQWGLTQDDQGKPWIVNAGGELGPINFQQPIVYGAFKLRDEFDASFKEVWPLVPIPDVQGGTKRFRPEEKTLNHFTATCGADIFRGDRLPADLRGDLLFCEPVGRLIRRTKITVQAGVTTLRNPYEQSEFIRSRDPYFRPVNLVTAPDGTLYITDMYRGIIQEGNWTKRGSYLRDVIEQYDLDKGFGRGRIWRLVKSDTQLGATPTMLAENPAQWVAHLAHPNGWWRDTAQKLLVLAQDQAVVPALQAMARSHASAAARFHAIWTLEGLNALTPRFLRETLQDADVNVRVAALRSAESLFKAGDRSLQPDVLALINSPSAPIAIQAMLTAALLKWPEGKTAIQRTAVASPLTGVKQIGAQLLNPLSGQLPQGYSKEERALLEKGQGIFMELCFACHGLDAKGTPLDGQGTTLAPPLAGSPTVNGHRDLMLNALLFGVSGPVNGRTYEAPMAPLGANSDEWIAAIVSYVRTGFGNKGAIVTAEEVARVRAVQAPRTEAWLLSELNPRLPQPLRNSAEWRFTTNHRSDKIGDGAPREVKLNFTAGPGQVAGTWLQVELPAVTTLAGLRLDCAKNYRNFPRAHQIACSIDGVTWVEPAPISKASAPVVEVSFANTPAKFIRITQTTNTANSPWSVENITLFEGVTGGQ